MKRLYSLLRLGFNTCWAGTYNKKNVSAKEETEERLLISMALRYRVNKSKERKSKTLDQVTSGKGENHTGLIME